MKITIHRGSKEIGGSCVELSSGQSRILLDFGMPLVSRTGGKFNFNDYKRLDAADLVIHGVLPNIHGLYDKNQPCPVDGIIISHPHFDHYGLSNYVRNDAKFFLGEATREIIGINNTFTGNIIDLKDKTVFSKDKPFKIGVFNITPFWMDHSAFDAYAFLIEAEGRKIFYTGDFRAHGRKSRVFKWFTHNAPEGVDYLLMEGTNIGSAGKSHISEEKIEEEYCRVFRETKGPCLIYSSGQNIDRIVSIDRACQKERRTLIVDFYIASVLRKLSVHAKIPHPSSCYPEIRVFYPARLTKKFVREKKTGVLDEFREFEIKASEIDKFAGSTAMIIRPNFIEDLERLKNFDGGCFIYSMWNGYKTESNVQELTNYLASRHYTTCDIHTSGHADTAALKKMAKGVNPKYIIPIHTFSPSAYKDIFGSSVMELPDNTPYSF